MAEGSTAQLRCAAVDLGASNGRVAVARFDGDRIALTPGVSFPTPHFRDGGTGWECWDVDAIEARIREGLDAAVAEGPLASVGVDTWGVDFVFVGQDGQRVGQAVCYRDERTVPEMATVFGRVPREEVYRRTGIQVQVFNTLYQLAATSRHRPDWIASARRLLFLPDWFHFRLSGAEVNEYTEASTSQLLQLDGKDWDPVLLEAAGMRRELLERPVDPGTTLGPLRGGTGPLASVKVIAPATHDTASAVAAIPLAGPDDAFISSGTWSLMGVESLQPYAGPDALRFNITNEGGVDRRYRVLQNLIGLWLAQRLREELGAPDHAVLAAAAEAAAPWRSIIDPEDPRFFNPPSMVEAFRSFCRETGQPEPDGLGAFARCAFESLALGYRRSKERLEVLRGRPLRQLRIVGGGCRNRLLNQLCADACGIPVGAGPVETSALGNACLQLRALGALKDQAEARALVARSFEVESYEPRGGLPDGLWERFAGFAARREESR